MTASPDHESPDLKYRQHLAKRHRIGKLFTGICFASTWFGVAALAVLLVGIVIQGAGLIDWQFLTSYDSNKASESGILAGLWGSFWLIFFTSIISVPVGPETNASRGSKSRTVGANSAYSDSLTYQQAFVAEATIILSDGSVKVASVVKSSTVPVVDKDFLYVVEQASLYQPLAN